ncbi:AbrB family transcriptional regulator [Neoroseomonas rubea]|uniref:AbrB family transcriptional regulator n=1 Tax=Neoroseomonas rubea TaxID=2748666 RepID=UPI0018E0028F
MPTPQPPFHAYLRTLLLCLLVGGALQAAGVPLGWMIGALLASAWLAARRAAAVPRVARPGGLVVLGLGLGQTFTAPVLGAVAGAFPAILAGGLVSILAGVAVAPIYRRIARSDARTAFFAAIPGGIMTMAVLAGRAGASVPAVTLAQSLRMGLVVLLYPPLVALAAGGAADAAFTAVLPPIVPGGLGLLLAGGAAVALVGERVGIANAAMLAPCLLAMALSAGGVLPSAVPRWMVDAAQVAMGMSLGERFGREGLGGGPRRQALASIASAGALVLLLVVSGLGLGWLTGLPLIAVVLGLAPGGMPEMAVTAKALDLAVPLVLGFHLVRTVLCNLIVTPLWLLVKVVLMDKNSR